MCTRKKGAAASYQARLRVRRCERASLLATAASSARYARATRPLPIAARSVAAVPVASAREAAAAEGSPLERLAEAAMSRSSAMV